MNAQKKNSATYDNFDNQNLNRISGSSGMSGFTNTLHMGAQGYQSECNSNRPSDCNSYVNQLNRDSYPQKSNLFAPARDLFEDDIEDKEEDMTVITTTSTSYLPFASNTVKDFFRSSMSPKKQRRSLKMKFSLKLSIQYETQIGEYLAVIGNIEELGNWTNFNKCQIRWTEGHNWVTENLVISSKSHFLYKYVIMENGKVKRWEKGANRIADLDVLPDMNKDVGKSSTHQLMTPSHSHIRLQKQKSISPEKNTLKQVQIIDEWEHFKIRFSINDPILEDAISHGDFMRIIGSTPKLGSQGVGEMEQTPPMRMSRAQRPFEWLLDKYGQLERPWEIIISFRNGELEFPNEIIYNYSKSNESGTSIVKEREPSRSMVIQQPETYSGELGKQGSIQWKNSQYVWIVNGVIDKADGNFLGGLYFDKIGDTKIFMGTYPLREDDIFKMRDKGITGVLNLQTENDIKQRGVPWKHLKSVYQQCNIRSFRFPLSDNNEDDYCANLFMVAQHLNNMINNLGLTVYIHCTSGISRAPTVVMVYLCLFKRVKQWQNPYYVAQFVKAFHLNSSPNMRAVQRVVEANLEFQRQQVDINSKAQISQEPISGQSDETQPEFYFPQMVEKVEKKKPMRNNMTPLKPRSAYIKKEYYRSQMDGTNKYDQRSVTPLLPNQSQKPLLTENLDKQDNVDDDQLSLQQKRQGLTDNEQSQKQFAIGQQNFENAQPVTSESATIQNDPDQFRSMLLPDEKPLINQNTPEKILKSANPHRFDAEQHNQKEELPQLDDNLGTGDEMPGQNKLDRYDREKKAQSPLPNPQPQIDFGFKPIDAPTTPQIDFGFKPVDVETEDISPSQVFAQEKDTQIDQQEQEQEIAQPAMEPEEAAEINQSVQSVEKSVKLHSQPPKVEEKIAQPEEQTMAPMNEPHNKMLKESVASEAVDEDDGLFQMQNNYKVQKAARAREFKRKRESSSRERSFMRNTNQKLQQNVNIKNILTDNLLFGSNSPQNNQTKNFAEIQKQFQTQVAENEPDNRFIEDIIMQGMQPKEEKNPIEFGPPPARQTNHSPEPPARQVNHSPEPPALEESPSHIMAPRSAVRPYTKSAQRQRFGQHDSVERTRRTDQLSANSNDSPSQRFSHFDQIKKNYAERRQQDELIRQQQLTAQRETTNLAIMSYITTELIDKECSRLIRHAFQEEMAQFHEEKLIAERRAREEAENEIARLREENLKAKNRTIEIEKLAREEAEKEIQRLKREKFERQQNELKRRQKMAEDRAERQRLMKMAEEMEQEKRRLMKIAEENEVERQRIQKEAEQLKQQENQHMRSQSLMMLQQAEEEEIERQKLQKIARDKEERMKLQKKYEEEVQKQQSQQQSLLQSKQMSQESVKQKDDSPKKTKEYEQEMQRLESIRKAQQELEELQRLRLQEEERLKKIKRDISIEEENQRSVRMSQQSPQNTFSKVIQNSSKETESRNNYYPKVDTVEREREIITISEQQADDSPNPLEKADVTPQQHSPNKSKVNVYYEVRSSNEGTNENGQNKSFEQSPNTEVNRKPTFQQAKTRNQSLNKVNSPNADDKSLQTTKHNMRSQLSGIQTKEEPTGQPVLGEEHADKPPVEVDLLEEDIESHCDRIFGKEAPIKFKCRPGNKIEETMQKLITKLNIRVPIVHIRAGIYLVGTSKVNLEQKFNHIMVRVGGGTERFDYYMPKNHRKFERQLVQYMSNSQSDLQTVVDRIIAGQKIKKTTIKKEEDSEKRKRNRSGNVAVKRVQVKLHEDLSSNAGSLQSRRTKEQIMEDRDRVARDLSSDRSMSQGGHFLNKSIVESINKSKMARGYSPIRMRPDLKNSFENSSIQNTEQSKIVPFTNQSQVASQQNPNKCGTPKYQLYDSAGHRDEPQVFRGYQSKTSKFEADPSPRHQFSQMQVNEPAKTSRKYRHPVNNFSRNANQKSHYLGAARNKQFSNHSAAALDMDGSSTNTQPVGSYAKYMQQTSSPSQKPTVYQKMLETRSRGERQTGHRI